MKTLKKTLCLVLAVVMAVGVLMIPASATNYDDFTDKDKIEHTTAAKVLTALGILGGNEKGELAPKQILKRDEGAKILVETVLGSNAKYLGNSVSPFDDVPAGNWAAGYIAYGANAGMIGGVGNNKFEPESELTGYEFAKLLLVAMGVDGEYGGSNWTIDVGLNAARSSLLADLDDLDLSKPLCRDDAIQMAFNALTSDVVGTKETEYIVTGADGTNLYTGDNETVAMAYAIQNQGAKIESNDTTVGSLGDKVYKLHRGTKTDDFKRTSVCYYANNDKIAVPIELTADETYDYAVSTTKIGADMGVASVSTKYTLNVYVDGTKSTDLSGDYHRNDATSAVKTIGSYGATVEVYDKTTDPNAPVFDVIVVNTYVTKLASKDIKAAKSATQTTDAVDAHIVLEWNGDVESLTWKTTEYKKDNVVLYTKAGGKVQSVELATPVTGKIARYNANANVTVDGTAYNFAAQQLKTEKMPSADIFSKEYVFYTDSRDNSYGYDVPAQAVVTNIDGYVYVKNYQVLKTGNAGDLFTEDVAVNYAVRATVMDVAGISKVVDVAVNSKTSGNTTTFSWGKPNTSGIVTSTDLAETTEIDAQKKAIDINGWIGYTVNEDGEYVFQSLPAVATISSVLKTAKNSAVTVDDVNKIMTSTSTYNVINTKTNKVSTTSSYSNIVIKNSDDGAVTGALVVYTDSSKAIVKDVYTTTNVDEVKATPFDYAYVVEIGASVEGGKEVTFYIGGEVTTYVAANASDFTKGNVYKINVSDTGIVTKTGEQSFKKLKGDATAGVVSYMDPGFILVDANAEVTETVSDDSTVVLETSTVIYNVTTDGAGAVDELEIGDTIKVVATDSKTAVIFITANA